MTTPERVRVGRGGWPKDGRGGTVDAAGTGFGPYYGIGAGERAPEGSSPDDITAVRAAVKAIQRALNWHNGVGTPIPTDGLFAERTKAALVAFQQQKQPGINRDMHIAATERSPLGLVHKPSGRRWPRAGRAGPVSSLACHRRVRKCSRPTRRP